MRKGCGGGGVGGFEERVKGEKGGGKGVLK